MGRVDKATEDGVEPNREDMLKLYEYQQANQAETSFGYKVGTVLGELPAFALEIGLTGGIYTGTKTATLKGAKYTLKRVLGKELRDKTAKYLAKHKILDGTLKFGAKSAAAIAGATMQTTFNEGIKEVGAWATDDFLPGGRIRLGMKEHMMGTLPITMEESGELEAAVFTEGDDFNEAFLKSVLSTGFKIPQKGVLLSTGNLKSKAEFIDELRILRNLGLKFNGTEGTAEFYKENGIEVETLFRPYDKEEPSILTYLNDKIVDLVINIPKTTDKEELDSDYIIRRRAIDLNIPLITNIQIAKRFVKSIKQFYDNDISVKSWDEYN